MEDMDFFILHTQYRVWVMTGDVRSLGIVTHKID